MSCFLYVNDEESTKKVDIDELYQNKQKRDLKQLSIFNKILNRIHTRIKFTGKKQKDETHIWFTVPEYIFGEPIYDKGDCIAYLVTKLEENGFLVKYVHPNTMFVCWSNWVPAYIRNEFKKKTGKLMDEKGIITEKKDSEPVDHTPKEQKYTPVSKYKPTGNFVYNPDILEKIDKKVSFS
jgi:hypothetical protein